MDYNRLKRERAQEITNQKPNNNSINPELHEYAYPFHYQSENNTGTRYYIIFDSIYNSFYNEKKTRLFYLRKRKIL